MKLRAILPGESPHIIRLWLDSFWWSKYAHRWRGPNGKALYRAKHGARLERLIERATVRVLSDDEGTIHGFAVVEPGIVHYAMAKRTFHERGVAEEVFRMMLGDELRQTCVYTHELPEFRGILGAHRTRDGRIRPSGYATNLPIPANWQFDEYAILEAS